MHFCVTFLQCACKIKNFFKSQEQKNKEGPVEAWAVPSMVYTIIMPGFRYVAASGTSDEADDAT